MKAAGATTLSDVSNLPVAKIGNNDLIGVTVYDAPELTRTVRVSPDGDIWLPMVKQPIHAAGLYPEDLEKAIAAALTRDHVLVDPVVTVSIAEYQSRPITVVGAVKMPLTFQATGNVTLLDAISRAQGLTDNAGSEILVSDQAPARTANRHADAAHSGTRPPRRSESLTEPELARRRGDSGSGSWADLRRGRRKKAGAFYITDGSESSVLKAFALSGGLDEHSDAQPTSTARRKRRGPKRDPGRTEEDHGSQGAGRGARSAGDILYIPRCDRCKGQLENS